MPSVEWPEICVVIDRRRLTESTRALVMLEALVEAGNVREWREVTTDDERLGPMEFVWAPSVPGTDDYGGLRYSATGESTTHTGIAFAEHNARGTVNWAAHAGFGTKGLFEQAQAYDASRHLPPNYFVTTNPDRLVSSSRQEYSAVSPEQALAVIGLRLRASNNGAIPVKGGLLRLDSGFAYRVAAVHLTRPISDLQVRRPPGSLHPLELPIEGPAWPVWLAGITTRIEEALECRDAMRLRELGYRPSFRSPSTLLTQLALALGGALDSLARAVRDAAALDVKREHAGWQKQPFRKLVREAWPALDGILTTASALHLINFVHEIRNTIHLDPIPGAGHEKTPFADPEDQLIPWPDQAVRIRKAVEHLGRLEWLDPSGSFHFLRPTAIGDELPELVAEFIAEIVERAPWPIKGLDEQRDVEHELWSVETGERAALMFGLGDVWRRSR